MMPTLYWIKKGRGIMAYSRLTLKEREIIYKHLAQGHTQKYIALLINRHPSTLSREIRRDKKNRYNYSPSIAEEHAKIEYQSCRRKLKIIRHTQLANFIEEKLGLRWSPEQISGFLSKNSKDYLDMQVSHETVYKYIYNQEDRFHRKKLISLLRQKRRYNFSRKKSHARKPGIVDAVPITERPEEVEKKQTPGHWEGDLVIGGYGKSAIGTLVERVTKYILIVPLKQGKNSETVINAFAKIYKEIPEALKRTLTYDRGTEMSLHKDFTCKSGIPVYFANPRSPWQRGCNENSNGLVRNYFPKGSDFRVYLDVAFLKAQEELNDRPRKMLNYATPREAFEWLKKNPEKTIADFLSYDA